MDLTVLFKLTYGMYIVGANDGSRPVGCVINTCFQVTSSNPLLTISLNKNNFTLDAIKKSRRFSLSILSEDSDPALIGKFGFYSSRDIDKYADFGYETVEGAPIVNGNFAGRLILDAEQFVECETHVLVIARLVDTIPGQGTPMTYSYYHNVIKGKAPKNAPTYVAPDVAKEEAKPKRRYECDICLYVAEVDGELPDDYVCPICGADRSHFKEI
ncbi:MAG: flavin reductase [Muribaculaceae bacterium]